MGDHLDTTAPFNGQIGFAPMPAAARVLAQFDRAKLGGFVEVAIGLLDMADGDPDLETTAAEDELGGYHAYCGPGCKIADPDSAAWVE